MSNCVEIRNWEIVIPTGVIDLVAWQDQDDSEVGNPIYYWYLAENHSLNPDGSITIRLGEGRSSHTWRDLRQTAMFLALVTKPGQGFSQTLTVADESDNFTATSAILFGFGVDTRGGAWAQVGSSMYRWVTEPHWEEVH